MALWTFGAPDGSELLNIVSNVFVFSYCAALLIMFRCRLDVEICISRIEGVKYPIKYICKGSNWVAVKLGGGQRRYDEITTL